jgi:hypothetical protein
LGAVPPRPRTCGRISVRSAYPLPAVRRQNVAAVAVVTIGQVVSIAEVVPQAQAVQAREPAEEAAVPKVSAEATVAPIAGK